MRLLLVFSVGLLFGAGLLVSGMSNPAKVLGFLDVTGSWDASLLFVMGSAVVVTAIGYRIVLRRQEPFFSNRFSVPDRIDIDAPLLGGATVFGIGWGLVGLCPGPAMTALVLAPIQALIFFATMLVGMALARFGMNLTINRSGSRTSLS